MKNEEEKFGKIIEPGSTTGFSLVELLLATLILGLVTAGAFALLADLQQESGYQREMQTVLDNTRMVLQTVEKYLRQAGNDPLASGLAGITIISNREVQIRADLKGSLGPANPDKGDPDGDVDDADETVTLRLNPANKSFEIVSAGGTAQLVSNHIHDLLFRCYDGDGNPTADGSRVHRIAVTVSGVAAYPHPKTGNTFGAELQGEVRVIS